MTSEQIFVKQKNNKKNWCLYYLTCPNEKIVRYVGITKNPTKRLKQHLNDRTNQHKFRWIETLKKQNKGPEITIVISGLLLDEAKSLEIKHGTKLRKLYGDKLTNIDEALGGVPPNYFGDKNYSAKNCPFKIWNDKDEEYYFDYQFEVERCLGSKIRNGIYRVLNGNRKSTYGYYACYIEQLETWKQPKNNKGSNSHFAQKRKFKIWNDKGEEHYFDYQFEAVKKLKLSQKHLSRILNNKQKTIKNYHACYLDELDEWNPPTDRRVGNKSNFAKKRRFVVQNIKTKKKYEFDYQFEAIKKLNIRSSGLSMLLSKKLKTHKGYTGFYLHNIEKNQ